MTYRDCGVVNLPKCSTTPVAGTDNKRPLPYDVVRAAHPDARVQRAQQHRAMADHRIHAHQRHHDSGHRIPHRDLHHTSAIPVCDGHGHRLCSGTGPHHLRSAGRMAELALDVRAAGGNRRRRDRGRLLHGAQRGRADPPAYRRAVRGTFDLRFRRCALRPLHCRRKRLGQHGRAGISSHWRNRPDTVHLAPDAAGTANA